MLGYRVERRAVVEVDHGFVKIVRPRRLQGVIAAHQAVASHLRGPARPEILDLPAEGSVLLSRVPGVSLHELVRGRSDPTAILARTSALTRIAEGLAEFHSGPTLDLPDPPGGVSPHTWAGLVELVEPGAAHHLDLIAANLPFLPPCPTGPIHGDLHDKNILLEPEGAGMGLVDLDGATTGVPEDDVANLAVHLGLRVLQAGGSPTVGRSVGRELYRQYRLRRPLCSARLLAAERHTWFRLSCLYRFRVSGRALTPVMTRLSGAEPG